jgi:putative endonuclease
MCIPDSTSALRSLGEVGMLTQHTSSRRLELRWTLSTLPNPSTISFINIATSIDYGVNKYVCSMNENTLWTVYILRMINGKHYIGFTSDLNARLAKHNSGGSTYTSKNLPLELITTITFKDKYKALAFEKYLKSGSGAAFMHKRFI